MWRIWLSIGVGITVGVLTILMGIITQARFTVILYRAVISIVLMGGVTFFVAALSEKFLLPYLLHKDVSLKPEVQEENGDGQAKQNVEELSGEEKEQAEFSPFTTENLNRVSPPNG